MTEHDLIIRNGWIIDGSGAPRFIADVAIDGDTITAIARHLPARAKRTIDATGKIVAPGFIDLLGHSERAALSNPTLESKVRQGVTTEVTGEGTTPAPINDQIAADRRALHPEWPEEWRTLGDFMRAIERNGAAVNFAFLVTTSNIRLMTLGRTNRPPTDGEMAEMKNNVDAAMRDGAIGISTALVYVPATFATTEEIIELSRVAASYGGMYFTHMRNESDRIDAALDETFRIGREAQIALNVWHLKLGGQKNWHRMPQILEKIEAARASGIDVAANIYPYVASSTELAALAPDWALEGGYSAFIARLKQPETRERIAREIEQSPFYGRVGGGEGVLITRIPNDAMKDFQRKRLSDVASTLGLSPVDALIHIFLSTPMSGGAVYFMMNEDDVRSALAKSWVSVGADSEAFTGDPEIDGAHPRAYGTFPRVLGHYVRDVGLYALEEGVRKVTSQAACRARLWDRGLLRPGMKADVVLFDENEIADRSTYEDPHHMSVGISDVIVNGTAVLAAGRMTGELPGRVLRRM